MEYRWGISTDEKYAVYFAINIGATSCLDEIEIPFVTYILIIKCMSECTFQAKLNAVKCCSIAIGKC